MRNFKLALAFALALACTLGAQSQQPIRYIIDCHCDPIPNTLPQAQKVALSVLWASNATWLLDTAEAVGAKVSFLSGGAWAELAAQGGVAGPCAVLLRRIALNHGQIGCHMHSEHQAGTNNWPDLPFNPSVGAIQQAWLDDLLAVQAAINVAFASVLPEPMSSLVSVRNAHQPADGATFNALMSTFNQNYRQGGTEEDYYGWYEHHIWNTYRPDPANVMNESLAASYVVVPQGAMLGVADTHHGIYQDMTLPAVKKQFLQLYLNWRHRDRTGAPQRVWTWGYGSHPTEYAPTNPTRLALPDWLAWLQLHFVSRVEPTGSQVFAFSTQEEAGAAHQVWEAANPGVESFGGHDLSVNWAEYPYLRAVAEEMHGFTWFTDLSLGSGIDAFHLKRGTQDAVVIWRASGTSTVNLSATVGPNVRVVNLETGALLSTSSSSVTVGQAPLIVTENAPRTALNGIPALGANISVRVLAAPATSAILAISLAQAAIPLPHYGTLFLDPSTLMLLSAGTTNINGAFITPITIPNAATLSGLSFYLQGATLDFSGASMKLAIDAVIVTIP